MMGAGSSMMALITFISKFTDNYFVIGAVSGAIAGASKGLYERKVNYNLSYFSKEPLNFDDDLENIIGSDTYDAPETEETEEEEE